MRLIFSLIVLLIVFPANVKAAYRGALIYSSTAISIPHSYYSAIWKWLDFANTDYDTDGMVSLDRKSFVISAGVSKVRLTCGGVFQHNYVGARQLVITKNNQSLPFIGYPGITPKNQMATVGTTSDIVVTTHVLQTIPGDVWGCTAWQTQNMSNGVDLNLYNASFSIEILE